MNIKDYENEVKRIDENTKMTAEQKSYARLALQDTIIPKLYWELVQKRKDNKQKIYLFWFEFEKDDTRVMSVLPIQTESIAVAMEQWITFREEQNIPDAFITFVYSEDVP